MAISWSGIDNLALKLRRPSFAGPGRRCRVDSNFRMLVRGLREVVCQKDVIIADLKRKLKNQTKSKHRDENRVGELNALVKSHAPLMHASAKADFLVTRFSCSSRPPEIRQLDC